jgi:VanZ family protein
MLVTFGFGYASGCIYLKKTRRAAEDWTFHQYAILALSAFVVAAAFAASDEFHQSFVPSRTASAHDVMLDCIGAFVAVLFCWMFARARSPQTAS